MTDIEIYFHHRPGAAKVYRTSDSLLHARRKDAVAQAATLTDRKVETIKKPIKQQ